NADRSHKGRVSTDWVGASSTQVWTKVWTKSGPSLDQVWTSHIEGLFPGLKRGANGALQGMLVLECWREDQCWNLPQRAARRHHRERQTCGRIGLLGTLGSRLTFVVSRGVHTAWRTCGCDD